MARPRKVPAVLVEATVRENGKLAALPSDTARLGYFYICLGAAKLAQPTPGMFTSKLHFREIAGRFARYLEAYLAGGLLEEAPRLCARCRERWSKTPPTRGQIVVHDWHEHQYDPHALERQRAYDERQRALQSDVVSDAVSDGQSDGVSYGQSDAVSDANLTGDSRGRGRDRVPGARRTLNVEPENDESGPPTSRVRGRNGTGPTLSKRELEAWRTFGPEWDAVKAAWLNRGLRLPPSGEPDDPKGQRAMLFQVLDARPTDLARWVAMASGKTSHDVVAWVLEQWHQVRAEAGVDEEPDADERDLPKGRSAERLSDILSRLPEPAEAPR